MDHACLAYDFLSSGTLSFGPCTALHAVATTLAAEYIVLLPQWRFWDLKLRQSVDGTDQDLSEELCFIS